jgi:hypothetical protein
MRVVFVHGWSVTNTDTYGGLPAALARNAPTAMDVSIQHLYLAKYISFSDEVSVDDIARGMQNAVDSEVMPKLEKGERFACVTHSTGGPVVRTWIDLYFRGKLGKCPMQHLVMLAPANHGSALAQLGKSRLSRMKFFAQGVQPGTGVLDWLELGSDQSWALNTSWLDYDCVGGGMYVFVLTGQTIDRACYDNLNSYTGEAGSDGVVRVAAANMNYGKRTAASSSQKTAACRRSAWVSCRGGPTREPPSVSWAASRQTTTDRTQRFAGSCVAWVSAAAAHTLLSSGNSTT